MCVYIFIYAYVCAYVYIFIRTYVQGSPFYLLTIQSQCVIAIGRDTGFTARKTIFPKSWNLMQSPRKYYLSINILAQKETVFPISKNFKARTFQ